MRSLRTSDVDKPTVVAYCLFMRHLYVFLFLVACGGADETPTPADAGAGDSGANGSDASIDSGSSSEADSGEEWSDAATIDDAAMIDGGRDAGDPCSSQVTFACGESSCTLHQLCVVSNGDGTCWDTDSVSPCSPCSTQYAAIDARMPCGPVDFPGSFQGSPESGCTILCQ